VRAAVFSVDEKTQCQALDRTQPSPPLKPGRAGTMTHDDNRHATVDLFAAMNLATGQVLTELRKTHTGADVLRVLQADRRRGAARTERACGPGQPGLRTARRSSPRGGRIRGHLIPFRHDPS
jgi:hypothetical protein